MSADAILLRDEEIKHGFILEFKETLNFTATCEKLGVTQNKIHALMEKDSDFKEAKALCETRILDNIESRIFKDAEKEDNKLGIFLLRTRRREKYGSDNTTAANVQVNVQVNLSEVEE